MKHIYIFGLLISASVLFSCSEDTEPNLQGPGNEITVSSYFEENYENLVQPMAQVFGDRSSIGELISFSNLPSNAGEAELNLTRLINNDYSDAAGINQKSRLTLLGKIQEALGHKNLPNTRSINSSSSLMDFILENDIEVYAPYLAENFGDSSLTTLTITY